MPHVITPCEIRLIHSLTLSVRLMLSLVLPMDWLNYHHLRYFWTVARKGGLRRAAEKLRVSPPSISAQIRALEEALGEKLFRRSGRGNVLTDVGQVVLRYADEIFSLGRELGDAVRQRPTTRVLRLHVGVADSFPKLVTQQILRPAFALPQPIHLICREGKVEDLLGQLVAHRLDVVLAGSLDRWFQGLSIAPRILAEFDDPALMKVMSSDGRAFIPLPSVVAAEAVDRFSLRAETRAPDPGGCRRFRGPLWLGERGDVCRGGRHASPRRCGSGGIPPGAARDH